MSRAKPSVRLPLREGVGASCVALQRGPWATLLDFLAERLPKVSRAEWALRLQAGDVLDEAGHPLAVDAAYRWPTRVYYYRALPPEPVIPFDAPVLYQDEHLLVVDKPHFLPVVPSGRHLQQTLLVRLKRQTGLADLVPIHRIDQDTAGLVMFSTCAQTRPLWFEAFRQRAVRKGYLAVAGAQAGCAVGDAVDLANHLTPGDHHMLMRDVPLGSGVEPNAFTRLTCLGQREGLALYHLQPVTGKRHQLRVQMAAWGAPLLHDRIYPTLEPELAPGALPDFNRPLQLLAHTLELTHAVTKQPLRIESQRRLAAWSD